MRNCVLNEELFTDMKPEDTETGNMLDYTTLGSAATHPWSIGAKREVVGCISVTSIRQLT